MEKVGIEFTGIEKDPTAEKRLSLSSEKRLSFSIEKKLSFASSEKMVSMSSEKLIKPKAPEFKVPEDWEVSESFVFSFDFLRWLIDVNVTII